MKIVFFRQNNKEMRQPKKFSICYHTPPTWKKSHTHGLDDRRFEQADYTDEACVTLENFE